MKKCFAPFCLLIFVVFTTTCFAQVKPKPKPKEKPKTEMEKMMKEAQMEMDNLDPETLRMMDSMGIKRPSFKNVPNVSEQQMKEAIENENRIVPKKNTRKITSIPIGLTDAKMGSYITSIQNKTLALLPSAIASLSNETYSQIISVSKNSSEAGNIAVGLWMAGQTEMAMYLLGKICANDPNNKSNIGNYASMLSMQGGQHLAIPILLNLNLKFPKNSTLLNNLGQAWFGLGELDRAEKYLDSAIRICAFHPQANLTKSYIQESKGNKIGAITSVRKAIKNAYSKEKEERLRELGERLKFGDLNLPFKPDVNPVGLNSFRLPQYPKTVSESKQLKPQWDNFLKYCQQKAVQLEKQKTELEERYQAYLEKIPDQIRIAAKTGGVIPIREPLFAYKASLVTNKLMEFYELKFKEHVDQFTIYTDDIEKIKKGKKRCVPEAPCTCHRDVASDYLRNYNDKKQAFDEAALSLQKHYVNNLIYWSQYTSTDEMQFELIKLEFLIGWLRKLSGGEFMPLFTDGEYDCVEEEPVKSYKLPDWDFTSNCKYNVELNYGVVKQQINCGHTTTTYNFGSVKYTDRELGQNFIGSTLILSPKVAAGIEVGPMTVEAFVGADITIDIDEGYDVKDWNATVTAGTETGIGGTKGPVKFGASVTNAIEVEIDNSGIKDVNIVTDVKAEAGIKAPGIDGHTPTDNTINAAVEQVNKGLGAINSSVKIGIQSRVSLVSGHSSLTGGGLLQGVTISQ